MIIPNTPNPDSIAHFALVDDSTKNVTNTIVIPSEFASDGLNYINSILEMPGTWIQFFPDSDDPKTNSVGIGSTYNETFQAFIPLKIFASWILNETTFRWDPPIPKPGPVYQWNEETQSWFDSYST